MRPSTYPPRPLVEVEGFALGVADSLLHSRFFPSIFIDADTVLHRHMQIHFVLGIGMIRL
jgi:hypothetical protein